MPSESRRTGRKSSPKRSVSISPPPPPDFSRRISDGGSKTISSTSQARALSIRRSSRVKQRLGSETYITCLIEDLRYALKQLGHVASDAQLEGWAVLVHEWLSADTRSFHSVHRVFQISEGCDPIQLLACFFRDSISCAADGKLSPKQQELVEGALQPQDPHRLKYDMQDDDKLHMVLDLFGLTPGQSVSRYNGLDVFLSALLATRLFGDVLPMAQLAQIATCMEGTIPFRPRVHGKTPFDRLHDRLTQVNDQYELGLSESDIVGTIQKATDLANRNLGNFASEDATIFLDHTWSLLPERSTALRRSFLYSVNDMLLATREMEVFLVDLETRRVFQSFRGVPEEEEMEIFYKFTKRNIRLGRKYIKAKLLSICVVAAFAVMTGGDAPMSFFCGDLPANQSTTTVRLGDSFPVKSEDELHQDCNLDVYRIMTTGRHQEQVFDTRNDPLAAFIYATLGDEGVAKALSKCSFPMRQNRAKDLLMFLPKEAVRLIGEDIGEFALSRTEAIQELLKDIEP